ncbi:MAG TPA: TetR/AcrR family transcriptional regulator [Trebonia sp.]|jgi:AcrR family transcriptional regulator|nr:TetR/AcrR family transcriptional regulator [Trebonia sp.]
MARPNASTTARERARAELTREIKEEAKRQLAVAGADGLSLRAVARSLGLVSSALYRYFPSRDDLLTALIIDAYNSLGTAVESAAEGADRAPRARWASACAAVRAWARANPHEYALIYGSPVPGYRAPEATVGPASRLPLAFIGILRDAGVRGAAADGAVPVTGVLAEQAAVVSDLARAGDERQVLPPGVMVRGVMAWTQLFGMVSFELFGQFVGSFDPPDAFFEHAVAEMAAFVGL